MLYGTADAAEERGKSSTRTGGLVRDNAVLLQVQPQPVLLAVTA